MRVLYAGDGPIAGAARYLLGVLRTLRADVVHVPPTRALAPAALRRPYDLIILSDMPARRVPPAARRGIVRAVEGGSGLLMVGGWASFSGPFGGWRGSEIEDLLPVRCLPRDDRTNFPGGAAVLPAARHGILRGLPFARPAAVCGLNRVLPRPGARVLLEARPVRVRGGGRTASVDRRGLPLLVVDDRRRGAFTSDFAPHWAGGLVDWGGRTMKIPVAPGVGIEVGEAYVRLVGGIVRFLAGR